MGVAICEGFASGHRLAYVRLLVEEASERGIEVVFCTTPEARTSPQFALHLGAVEDRMTILMDSDPCSPRTVNRLAAHEDVSTVLVPDGDRPALRRALWVSRRVHKRSLTRYLIMRDPAWELPKGSLAKVKLSLKRILLWVAAHRRDVELVWLRSPGARASGRRKEAVDPVSTPASALQVDQFRRKRLLNHDLKWFGIVGGINARKNPDIALAAFEQAALSNAGFLLLGPVDRQIREALTSQVERLRRSGHVIRMYDEAIAEAEMNAAVAALHAVVVAYSTHAPPSTLGKAAAAGTHVLLAGSFKLHSQASELSGSVASALTVQDIGQAMTEVESRPRPERVRLDSKNFTARLLMGAT